MDDLQFQLEEQDVISGDQLESATETNVQKISNLGQELEEERRLTQQLRDQLKVSVVYRAVGPCISKFHYNDILLGNGMHNISTVFIQFGGYLLV